MLTDLASMYLNAILNTKKLVDFKIIILFNCKWLQCDLIAISHSFYWKKSIYLISTYFSVFEIAFKYILARSVSITFTTYIKIILSNSKDVYSKAAGSLLLLLWVFFLQSLFTFPLTVYVYLSLRVLKTKVLSDTFFLFCESHLWLWGIR